MTTRSPLRNSRPPAMSIVTGSTNAIYEAVAPVSGGTVNYGQLVVSPGEEYLEYLEDIEDILDSRQALERYWTGEGRSLADVRARLEARGQ